MALPSPLPPPEPIAPPAPSGRADLLFGASLIGLTVLVVGVTVLLRAVAIPVLLGGTVAYTLDPLVSRLERRGLSRTLGALVIGLLLAALAVGFLAVVVPALAAEATRVPTELRALSKLGLAHFSVPPRMGSLLSLTADVADRLLPAISELWGLALASTGTAVSLLAGALVTPLVAFYLLRDAPRLLAALAELVPSRHREVILADAGEIDSVMAGFVRGQLTVAAILSVLYSVTLELSGVHLALLIGVVTGFGNTIPYVGLISGLILSLLLALLHWEGPAILLKIAICYGGLSLLDSAVLTPRLVGNRVGLPAAAVVVSILSFGAAFGFAGVLVAVPATALLKVAVRALLKAYRASAWYA